MYVNAILNLTVQRLRALFPEWVKEANSYVAPNAVDDGHNVGQHWISVYDGGSSFDQRHYEAGSLGRLLKIGVSYYHILASDQAPRYTLSAITIRERMRQIVGTLDAATGPTGLGWWMPYDVDTLAFTSRGRTVDAAAAPGITQANPGNVTTTAAHNLATGQTVRLTGVVGMTEVNGETYRVTVVDALNFTIGVDTTGFTEYVSGGTARRTGMTIIPDRVIRRTGTEVTGRVADVQVTSGTWTNGDAAGIIYLGEVSGVWTAGQVDADAYGSAAASVTEVCQSGGATTQTQMAAQPLRPVGETSVRAMTTLDYGVTVQQDFELITIAGPTL
jgi:hypothetical protein